VLPEAFAIRCQGSAAISAGIAWNSTTFGLREAKGSAEIDNVATSHDELLKDNVTTGWPEAFANPAAEDVLLQRQVLRVGFHVWPSA
jgi:hypothetical protein